MLVQKKANKLFVGGICSIVLAAQLMTLPTAVFAEDTTVAETTVETSAEDTTVAETTAEATVETSAEATTVAETTAEATTEAISEETGSDEAEDQSPVKLPAPEATNAIKADLLAEYVTGAGFDEAGTEIVAYNPTNKTLYSVNGATSSLDVIDASQLAEGKLQLKTSIVLADLGVKAGDVTSVAVHPSGSYVAVAAPAEEKTDNGSVVFLDAEGKLLSVVEVGALPDSLAFSADGLKLVVANEGEPSDDYKTNPAGSISVIKTTAEATEIKQDQVVTLEISKDLLPSDLRPLGTTPEDQLNNVEPEYVTIDNQSAFAYVSLQEVNAIAKVDLNTPGIEKIASMGYKDHTLPENGLDTNDEDGKPVIQPEPVLGLYQPDGLAYINIDGTDYILTANEGDSQDYEGYSEETDVKELLEGGFLDLKAENYAGISQEELDKLVQEGLKDLINLKVTTDHNFKEGDKHTALVAFGGRSFSILKAEDLSMIYDSGDYLEMITGNERPDMFNPDFESETEFKVDGRSDNKGPEPEAVVAGKIGERTYAFIAMERSSAVMVFDVTSPHTPIYVTTISRPKTADGKFMEIAPEGLQFIPAEVSPTGKALLFVAHEVSGVISVYQLTDSEAGDESSASGQADQASDETAGSTDESTTTVGEESEVVITTSAETSSETTVTGETTAEETTTTQG